ncbi:hypothetical protein JTB14_030248 [Gonioctena quinquepunctata]|nr:hypothetical protein JTB14_030248 [Gonioctena quinquepunctata]
MDDLQYIAAIEDLEIAEQPVERHNRFENLSPFEILNEDQFLQTFRLTKELCRFVIDTLTPFMRPQRRATDLSIRIRVLVALRFFASGVIKWILEGFICGCFSTLSFKIFYEDFNFPGVVGCVDCTHIAIFTPKIIDAEMPEHIYVNRKGYHSMNVQLICDSRLMIINVVARATPSVALIQEPWLVKGRVSGLGTSKGT